MIYLELSDGESHKFYQVAISGTEVTIRYGRIGTQGQSSSTTYATPEIAQAEATKKINEKLKKGYVRSQLIEAPQFLKDLPPQFEPMRDWLKANFTSYIKIKAGEEVGSFDKPNSTGDPLTVWQSKIGGNPYFPKELDYPTDQITGQAMPLLLQINCAEVPKIAGFDFPQAGILQFYLGFEPADAHLTPDKYRVLYFPEISHDESDLITDFSFIEDRNTIREIYNEIYPLEFVVGKDLFWESRYGTEIEIPEDIEELSGAFSAWIWNYDYENQTGMRGSKLGGYVDFHADVNDIAGSANGRLLLELRHPSFSDDYFYFFIPEAQLSDRDFSEVEFYFVCD